MRGPKITFGLGSLSQIADGIDKKCHNVLILTGANSSFLYPQVEMLWQQLRQRNLTLFFEKMDREPSPFDIDKMVKAYENRNVDLLLALGGGSVIDAGKAVSAMLPLGGSVRTYLEGVGTQKHPGCKISFIAIPTTSGTGSEATSNAVLSETGMNGYKRSLRHENLIPDRALVDPSLTLRCPSAITASGGMDAFTQLMESFLSVKANPYTDALALDGIHHVHRHLLKAYKNGEDLNARSGMAYAALVSGICLSNAGLGLVHGFAGSIGGYFNIPHGVVCGTLMAVVNRYNIKALLSMNEVTEASQKYEILGKLLSDKEGKGRTWYMQFLMEYLDKLSGELNMQRLSVFGIREPDLHRIAEVTDHKANPVKFQQEDIVTMLRERL
jgi:alcohol dehydrogenase class IV